MHNRTIAICLMLAAMLCGCGPPCDTESGGGASTSTGGGGEGGTATQTSSETVTCAPDLAFDPNADATHHLDGSPGPIPSGSLIGARFEPFHSPTFVAPLVYVYVDDNKGCHLPDEVLSGAWEEPNEFPTTDPPITQSLISPDMVKPTADPHVFRVRLDPITYTGSDMFDAYAYHAVVMVPGLCVALYSPSCDPTNGFLHRDEGWSALSTLTDASPGLGLYTDP